MLIPSYFNIAYCFSNIICTTKANTIEYILHKIYIDKSIKPFCKKSIFKNLLVNLTKECVFSMNSSLIQKNDGCSMGDSVSVVFSDIYVCKMEVSVVSVVPAKPVFC